MPDSTTLIALAKALDVSVDYFFRPYAVSLDGIEFRKKKWLCQQTISCYHCQCQPEPLEFEGESSTDLPAPFLSFYAPRHITSAPFCRTNALTG